jgi:hypothetical protein
MGGLSKAFTAAAAVYVGLVLVKNGTLPSLVTTAAKGTNQFIGGIKGLTNAA